VQSPEGCKSQQVNDSGKLVKIYQCRECGIPKWVPDPSNPGELRQNKDDDNKPVHHSTCPRSTGTYTHKQGQKAGQVAAHGVYKR
jgi:hypothetical protein